MSWNKRDNEIKKKLNHLPHYLGGFKASVKLSKDLADIVGGEEMTRQEVEA